MMSMSRVGAVVYVSLFLVLPTSVALAQAPVITGLHGGLLTWSHAAGTNAFRVQWSGDLMDANGWRGDWWDLDYIESTGTTSSATVPVFYRIVQDTNVYDNMVLRGAWFFLLGDAPLTSQPSNGIYVLSEGDGNLWEHSGFNNEGPDTGFYTVNKDGSFSAGFYMGGHPIVTMGRLLSLSEGVIHPLFPGTRLIKVPDISLCQGNWSGTLTETIPPYQVHPMTFEVTETGALLNLTGFKGPSAGHFLALAPANRVALGCVRTGESITNAYNQISFRGVISTNRIEGVYEIDEGVSEAGTFTFTRP